MHRFASTPLIPLLALALAAFPLSAARACDTSEPEVKSLEILPGSVDVSDSDKVVTLRARIVDPREPDGCGGVQYLTIQFRSPAHYQYVVATTFTRISGDEFDGIYEIPLRIPRYSEPGTWTLYEFRVGDKSQNTLRGDASTFAPLGLPTTLEVQSSPFDIGLPQLVKVNLPSTVDVTSAAKTVNLDVKFTDNLSGLKWVAISLRSPSGVHWLHGSQWSPSSGTRLDGVYRFPITFSTNLEPGTWTVSNVRGRDNTRNIMYLRESDLRALGLDHSFTVVGSTPDTTAPQVLGLRAPRQRIDCSLGPEELEFEVRATDDISGVSNLNVVLRSPSGSRHTALWAPAHSSRISGDEFDGWYRLTLTLPACSEEGCWSIEVGAVDFLSNQVRLTATDLAAAGLPKDVCNGLQANGSPRAAIRVPLPGKKIKGRRVTIVAGLIEGTPADTQQVRFQYRLLGGIWSDVPPANLNHPNPDLAHPYFVHWNVSAIPTGTYELRAVAANTAGVEDASPETIQVAIGAGASLHEDDDASGRGKQSVEVVSTNQTRCLLGSKDTERLSSVVLPSAASHDDWLNVVSLEPREFSGGRFTGRTVVGGVEVKLGSLQSQLSNGRKADVLITYPDQDDDGVVDGSTTRVEDLALYYYDPGTQQLTLLEGQARSSQQKVVRGQTPHFSTFVLMERLPTGTIEGRVTSLGTGAALPGVKVIANPTGTTTTTDATGRFALDLEAGTYTLQLSLAGHYSLTTGSRSVVAGATLVSDGALAPGSLATLAPAVANEDGGETATISGAGLVAGSTVEINGNPAGNVQRLSDAQLTFTYPPHPSGGPYALRVVRPDGQSLTLADAASYVVAPAANAPAPSAPAPPTTTPAAPASAPDPAPALEPATSNPALPSVANVSAGGGGGGGGGGCQLSQSPTKAPGGLLACLLLGLGLLRRRP